MSSRRPRQLDLESRNPHYARRLGDRCLLRVSRNAANVLHHAISARLHGFDGERVMRGQAARRGARLAFAGRPRRYAAGSSGAYALLGQGRCLLTRQATAEREFLPQKSPKTAPALPLARSLSQSTLPLALALALALAPSRTKTPNAPQERDLLAAVLASWHAGSNNDRPKTPAASPTPPRQHRRKCPQQTTQSSHPPRSRSHTRAKRRNVVRPAEPNEIRLNPLAGKT